MGANFDNACLISCNLNGANLSPSASGSIQTKLTGAFLQGAQFAGTKLQGADLANAVVALKPGTVQTQHCDGQGKLSMLWPMNFPATTGLDEQTLQPDTVCPNGRTYAANRHEGLTREQMLAVSHPRSEWTPVGCKPSARELERAKAARLAPAPPAAPTGEGSDPGG